MPEAKPLILVLEDEKELSALIVEELQRAGMDTQPFYKTASVLPFLKRSHANLLLLDVGLPDGTGFDVLHEVRKNDIETPVIFLTANDDEASKVRGLDLGADDYIGKPFSFPELIARIHAVLRRTETAKDARITRNVTVTAEPFEFCGCTVTPERLEIRFPDGQAQSLGRKELGILPHVAANAGSIITRRELIHAVWGIHADVKSRSLDQYIVKIRDMLTKHDCSTDAFRTIHGVGYFYEADSGGEPAEVTGSVS